MRKFQTILSCRFQDNVVGTKCSECRPGTFGLSIESPAGCTECFCFGRSAYCSQAGLTRAAIHTTTDTNLTLVLSGDTRLVSAK